ncbi:hypothetical protein [Lichenihabitans psoromatis]|uniref:hypothetical protein n=1 Tax=Lichenihabitans psoromatis TaxID=2528642 RepID=UPI001035E7CA|nr:hypothetical protein [Lichenihabitans psoromatis]
MTIGLIGFITLLLGLLALARGPALAMMIFAPLTLLGSAAAMLLGGAGSIQPAHLFLGFVTLILASRRSFWTATLRSLTFPNDGFWLLVTVSYGVFGAIFFPRVLAGITSVNAIGVTDYGPSLLRVPLGPSSGNITQSIYLVADLMCFLLARSFAGTPLGFSTLTKAMLLYCTMNIAFALIDVATFWTNTGFLLDFIRNADYQLHIETVVTGLKRIVGSFTETSSFAYASLGCLGFAAELWLAGIWPRRSLALSAMSLVLLLFSTSSTAYAATPLVLAWLYGSSLLRAARDRVTPATYGFLAFTPLAVLVVVAVIVLNPVADQTMRDFLTVMLFDKGSSQSGIERGQWNETALQNAIDTFGLGGGLGSIRASSFPIALLSNLGIPGTIAFTLFLASIFLRRASRPIDDDAGPVQRAARTACVGLLIGATVSGALVDLGMPFFLFAALASAEPRHRGRVTVRGNEGVPLRQSSIALVRS